MRLPQAPPSARSKLSDDIIEDDVETASSLGSARSGLQATLPADQPGERRRSITKGQDMAPLQPPDPSLPDSLTTTWPSSAPSGPLQRAQLDELAAAGSRQALTAREPQSSVTRLSADTPAMGSGSRLSRRSMYSGYAPLQAAAAAQSLKESRNFSARGLFRAAARAVVARGGMGGRSPTAQQSQQQQLPAQQNRLQSQPSQFFPRPSAAGVHAVALAHSRAMAAAAAAAGNETGPVLSQRRLSGDEHADDEAALRSSKARRQSTTSSGGASSHRPRTNLRVRSDLLDMSAFVGEGAARYATPEEAAAVVGLLASPTHGSPSHTGVAGCVSPSHPSLHAAGAAFRTSSLRRMNETMTADRLSSMADVVKAVMQANRSLTPSSHSRSPASGLLRRSKRGSNATPTSTAAATDGAGSGRSSAHRAFAFNGTSPQPASPARSEKAFFPQGDSQASSSVNRKSSVGAPSPHATGFAGPDRSGENGRLSLLSLPASAAANSSADGRSNHQDASSSEDEARIWSRRAGSSAGGGASNTATPGSPVFTSAPAAPSQRQPMRPSLKSASALGSSTKRLSVQMPAASGMPGSPNLGGMSRQVSQRVSFSLTPLAAVASDIASDMLGAVPKVPTTSSSASIVSTSVAAGSAVSDQELSTSEADTDVGSSLAASGHGASFTVSGSRRQSLLTKQGSESQLTVQSTNSGGDRPAEVFLGGACNPTRWRFTVAIPFLEACGITYYNPQVSSLPLASFIPLHDAPLFPFICFRCTAGGRLVS
jgi:hypothetical protein